MTGATLRHRRVRAEDGAAVRDPPRRLAAHAPAGRARAGPVVPDGGARSP
ncbi:MAG: hypothetical protein MZV64_73475 [Ignavibacteriales bacterium]|nr:hypothetical protein [Ignavibacteriales bacterium]